MPFRTKITRARFTFSPFSSEQMEGIGQTLVDSISQRISRAENADDAPARPLKPGRNGRRGYPDYKIARGKAPIRDWNWRGKTMRSMKVLSANENRVVIGFANDEADVIAHINNRREKMFGVSPKDREAVYGAVNAALRDALTVTRKAA